MADNATIFEEALEDAIDETFAHAGGNNDGLQISTYEMPADAQQEGDGFAPGFSNGTGVVSGETINQTGKTFGTTTLDTTQANTAMRLANAQSFLTPNSVKTAFGGTGGEARKRRAKFFNNFSHRIHHSAGVNQPALVGPYFPAITKLEEEERQILSRANLSILTTEEQNFIRDLKVAQVETHRAAFKGEAVPNLEEIQALEVSDLDATRQILAIKRTAAERVLAETAPEGKAEEVISQTDKEVEGACSSLSSVEIESRKVERLMKAAADAKLENPEREKDEGQREQLQADKTRLAQIKEQKDKLWKDKFAGERDFQDAIGNNSVACSEYASFSAVSLTRAFSSADLAREGVRTEKATGHVYKEGDRWVGSHAYDVIVEKRDGTDYVTAVFEGTSPNNSYKEVMNNVTLEDFKKNHATLVTFNERTGWATYGTGNFDNATPKDKEKSVILNNDNIVATDTQLIAEQKIEYIRGLDSRALTDRIHQLVQQYNITDAKDNFDGNVMLSLAEDHENPRFAAAMKMLAGLPDRVQATPEQLAQYQKVDALLSNQDITDSRELTRLAVTEQTIAGFEKKWPAVKSIERLHEIVNADGFKITAQMREDNPWLEEAAQLLRGKDTYSHSIGKPDGAAYDRVKTMVMDNQVSMAKIDAIEKTLAPVPLTVAMGGGPLPTAPRRDGHAI
jgi:hypothetical protein